MSQVTHFHAPTQLFCRIIYATSNAADGAYRVKVEFEGGGLEATVLERDLTKLVHAPRDVLKALHGE